MKVKRINQVEISSKLFNKAYLPYLDAPQATQIFFGGSSSGKSKFLAQRCVYDIMRGERNYIIVRNTANTLRTSVLTELEKVIDEWGVKPLFKTNYSNAIVTCSNWKSMILRGLDDVERVKSTTAKRGALTDILIEEATEINRNDYKQLTKRLRGLSSAPKRVTMAFNPILQSHWIYEEFFGQWDESKIKLETENLLILKTTYKDNAFLTAQDRRVLEEEKDEYFYNVYTLGNWGTLSETIFNNYRIEDLTEKSKIFDRFDHGLDFGYSNDPTAYVKTYFHSATKTLYIYREYANKEVTNDQIAKDLKPYVEDDVVICDSAEPKSIQELCVHDLSAVGANKGKDSVLHGIQWLKGLAIVIDESCQNVINNFKTYHWLKDREGNVLNKPVDKFNDFIDAIRYANEHHMVESGDYDIGEANQNLAARADW